MQPNALEDAYRHCRELAQSHYENFPVASRMLPAQSRDAVAVIYAFARTADDFADEGNRSQSERLALLDDYERQLTRIAAGNIGDDPVFIALADVIRRHQLPLQLFHDLLSAFRQDVTKTRYADFDQVLDYCRRSANPVGRLLLHLHGEASDENLALSDKVCSALQLINFLQDLQQDYCENNRIYLPQDALQRFGVDEKELGGEQHATGLTRLVDEQLAQVRHMMLEGARLGTLLHGRFGLEIRLIIEGGLMVIEKLAAHDGNVFARPRLHKSDYLRIAWRALNKRRHCRQ